MRPSGSPGEEMADLGVVRSWRLEGRSIVWDASSSRVPCACEHSCRVMPWEGAPGLPTLCTKAAHLYTAFARYRADFSVHVARGARCDAAVCRVSAGDVGTNLGATFASRLRRPP